MATSWWIERRLSSSWISIFDTISTESRLLSLCWAHRRIRHTSSIDFRKPWLHGGSLLLSLCLNFKVLDRIRAAMTPRWSRAIVLAALFSDWLLVLISSKDDTYGRSLRGRHSGRLAVTYHEFTHNTQQQTSSRPLRPV